MSGQLTVTFLGSQRLLIMNAGFTHKAEVQAHAKKHLKFSLVCSPAAGIGTRTGKFFATAGNEETVDAITGRWLGSMTARIPGMAPETFNWTMDCRPVALGAGASCANE